MHALIRTARTTGLLYLGLAITGAARFPAHPVAALRGRRSRRDAGQPGRATSRSPAPASPSNCSSSLTQALAAVWFYRLFRTADPLAAGGIAAFGLVNAVAVLVSAALLATAVEVALDPVGDAAATVQLLYLVSGNLWGVGALFFGLWLIPMGWCVLRSGWMPRAARLDPRRRRHRLPAQRVRQVPRSRRTGRRRRPRLPRDRGRVLDGRLPAGPRRPPPRTRRSAARRAHGVPAST